MARDIQLEYDQLMREYRNMENNRKAVRRPSLPALRCASRGGGKFPQVAVKRAQTYLPTDSARSSSLFSRVVHGRLAAPTPPAWSPWRRRWLACRLPPCHRSPPAVTRPRRRGSEFPGNETIACAVPARTRPPGRSLPWNLVLCQLRQLKHSPEHLLLATRSTRRTRSRR